MKPISKKTAFAWLGSLVALNLILVWVMGYLCNVTGDSHYCDYGAFGLVYVFQAIIYGALILFAIAYVLLAKYGLNKTASIFKTITLIFCFALAVFPVVMNIISIISAQRGIALTREWVADQTRLDAQKCAEYKAQEASFPRDGSSMPTPPRNCR